MKLIVLSSSSKANGYLLSDGVESLIIECGVKLIEVKKVLDFDVSSISGCLCTHFHHDHIGYIEQYLDAGISVYTSKETIDNFNFKGFRRPNICEPKKRFSVGNFKVLAFSTQHDAVGSLGFIISHEKTGNVLFLTDSFYSKYKFANLSHILIEANYSLPILEQNIKNGGVPALAERRLRTSHMSIETCEQLLLANDLSQTKNIVLIHLSSQNSNAKEFQEKIVSATGIKTTVAEKGVEIDFNLNEF